MKATIILEGATQQLIDELKNNSVLKDLGTKFKVIKVKKHKASKRKVKT